MSPLNWGIGHAARLVPVAHQLHAGGNTIFICASGASLALLRLECPYAQFVTDVVFEVSYSKKARTNGLKLLAQFPKMWWQVFKEHQLLKKLVKQYQIDCIIADNRYGFYHASVPSVFITHQLNIQVPFGGKLINFWNHYFIKKFNACWVPDEADNDQALAGKLSRNNNLKHISYIGLLSRASALPTVTDKKAPVLYLLSGVEPQRSLLEQLIIKYHTQHPHQAILIRGTQQTNTKIEPLHNLIVYDLCNAKQLQSLVAASKYVVCRSGYSSLMDLVKWHKNALLVPTPGQFEQEYLAQFVTEKKWFCSINQADFLKFKEQDIEAFQCPSLNHAAPDFEKLLETLF